MFKYSRPNPPTNFETQVGPYRLQVEQAVLQGNQPQFNEKWKDYKDIFSEAQEGRCGFCEMPVIGSQDGDVEHYAPKSTIHELLSPGTEQQHLSRVVGRKFNSRCPTGYWWLAYNWNNYLLCCAVCNRKWKQALFPLDNDEQRDLPPTENSRETARLLHPFGRKNPSKHLEFGLLGEVRPRKGSRFGRATIEVCGLDRPSLRNQRLATIEDTLLLLDEYSNSVNSNDKPAILRCLRAIHRLGAPRSGARFPGVVRSLFENSLEIKWQTLEKAIK